MSTPTRTPTRGFVLRAKGALRLGALVALALGAAGLPSAPVGASSAAAGPGVRLDAPRRVAVGEAFELTATLSGARDAGGYEGALRWDTAAAEFGGVVHPRGELARAGRDAEPLAVGTADGVAFGLASCPAGGCADGRVPPAHRAGLGGSVRFTVSITPTRPGTLEIALDNARLVEADGTAVPGPTGTQTVRVQVGNDAAFRAAPGRPAAATGGTAGTGAAPGPFDVTGDGEVANADVVEEVFGWKRAHRAGVPCGPNVEARLDVNHDGCLDLADVQLVAAHLGGAGGGATRTARRGGVMAAPLLASPQTFTVTSTADAPDANPGDGICATAQGACTLRAAIIEADYHGGADTIAFNLPGSGVHTIQLTSYLPSLWDASGPTTIDGYTQPGAHPNTDPLVSNAAIMVQIAGTGPGPGQITALGIGTPGNVIRGLAFYKMDTSLDVYGAGAHDNRIVGDFIGTDAAGVDITPRYVADANGVSFSGGASNNYVGSPAPADRNVVSGNANSGIATYDVGTDGNVFQGNLIGLSPPGDRRRPNFQHGVDINTGSANNVIGGTGPGERNVSSGNGFAGIEISHNMRTPPRGNRIVGNYVGTDARGVGRAYTGNTGPGIYLEDSPQDNTISDNVVGMNGGQNGVGGIRIEGYTTTGNVVANNRVGVGADGSAAPNLAQGIQLIYDVRQTTVGPGNVIANNPVGITLDSAQATNDTITRNSIYGNTGKGINLAPGANQDRAAPVLANATAATAGGTACGGCTVEVFVADRGAGQAGQGQTFAGSATAAGDGSFSVPLSGVGAGQYLTATATDAQGNTSQFAANLLVSGGSPTPTPTPTATNTPTPTSTPTNTPTPTDTPASSPTPTNTPTNTATPTDTPSPTATNTAVAGANLLSNPSYEADLSGWYAWQAGASRVGGGHAGGFAARVAYACPSGSTCTAYTWGNVSSQVPNPPPGGAYSASLWVKGQGSAVGKAARLVLRENGGAGASAATSGAAVTLTGGWQQLTVSRTIAASDRSGLELYVTQANPAGGDALVVDDASLVKTN